MFKRLMIVGGILSALFFLFHVFVGYRLHHLTQLDAHYRGLLEGFNFAASFFIFLIAYASFLLQKDLHETKLGHAVLAMASLLFLTRAAEEFILFEFNAAPFFSCLLVGAIYAWALVIATRRERPRATSPLAE